MANCARKALVDSKAAAAANGFSGVVAAQLNANQVIYFGSRSQINSLEEEQQA